MAIMVPARRHDGLLTAAEILLVAAVALGARAFNLLSLPIFLDEVTYLDWAMTIWDQKTRAALFFPMLEDGKQPLFMWLAGGTAYLFPDPLVAGRMVSVVAGVMSAVGIYLAGRWLAGRKVGLLAGLLYALVPFNLFYDRMALVEGLLNAAGVWAFALSVFIASRTDSRGNAVIAGLGLGVALGAGIWTKMPGVFFVAFPILCALLIGRPGKRSVSAVGFTVAGAVFALLAVLLVLAPNFENIIDKSRSFSESPESLLTFPVGRWLENGSRYWSWFTAYLPDPLWEVVLASVVWGLIRWSRPTLLLLGCWAAFTMPTILTAISRIYESRYVAQGTFPLLLLAAAMLAAVHAAFWLKAKGSRRSAGLRLFLMNMAALATLLVMLSPSIDFDLRLLGRPESAPLAATDRAIYITGWSAGYGFMDAVKLVRERAEELTGRGQPVIVLGYYWRGHTHAGLKLYMRGMKNVFYYVDMHLARDPQGFIEAWSPHGVPILVVGNSGLERLDEFERAVPEAKRIGYFPKPGGQSTFRVYEVAVADLKR